MKMITRLHIACADYLYRRKQRKLFCQLASVGRNVYIKRNPDITSPQHLHIGDNVWIGENFFVKGEGKVTIGNGSIISKNVEIWSSNHNYNSTDLGAIPYDKRMVSKPVTIGENVWIGSRVTIVPGVTIGEGAVVGAGAVVTKDIPIGAVVGGNPASILKYRNMELYWQLKNQNKIYLDVEYDFDRSSLRKSEYMCYKHESKNRD